MKYSLVWTVRWSIASKWYSLGEIFEFTSRIGYLLLSRPNVNIGHIPQPAEMQTRYSKMFPRRGGNTMSSIRKITASTAVPDDLAKRLGPSGVNEILLMLWQGYHDLIADSSITISENAEEDDITLEWYGKISQRWANENRASVLRINNIGPVHQYPDPTLKRTVAINQRLIFAFVIGILQIVILVQNARISIITRKIKLKDTSIQE